MQTVFVSGAEGFLGSRLTAALRNEGYAVVSGVRNRARKLAIEREQHKALVCDVSDPINVARVIASVQPDAVIHLASMATATHAADEPLLGYQSIVTAWANMLDAVRRTVPRAHVVLASACDVYGTAGDNGQPLTEITPTKPITTFGSLKRAAESIAHTFYRDFHLNITIARPFHYVGAGQPGHFFFGAVARQLAAWDPSAQGQTLRLPDLSCQRDLLHVDDVAKAYLALLKDGRPNEIYNIASGQGRECREIVQIMLRNLNLSLQLEETPPGAHDSQIRSLVGDHTRITSDTGWQPTSTIEAAIADLTGSARSAVAQLQHASS